jgi:hypothetical protein
MKTFESVLADWLQVTVCSMWVHHTVACAFLLFCISRVGRELKGKTTEFPSFLFIDSIVIYSRCECSTDSRNGISSEQFPCASKIQKRRDHVFYITTQSGVTGWWCSIIIGECELIYTKPPSHPRDSWSEMWVQLTDTGMVKMWGLYLTLPLLKTYWLLSTLPSE